MEGRTDKELSHLEVYIRKLKNREKFVQITSFGGLNSEKIFYHPLRKLAREHRGHRGGNPIRTIHK